MTTNSKEQILIIAGEASGDMHGAALLRHLKSKLNGLHYYGIGGELLKGEGFETIFPVEKTAILGFFEVIKHLPFMRRVFNTLVEEVEKRKTKAVILIDYPGFNLRFAAKLRKIHGNDIKIFYYISPQVWAWKKKRVKTISEIMDSIAVVFPFEEDIYDKNIINTKFVGHPLLDIVKPKTQSKEFYQSLGVESGNNLIGLLPGSRKQEIERHLPIMLETIKTLRKSNPDIRGVLGCSREIENEYYKSFASTDSDTDPSILFSNEAYDVMFHSKFLIVCSGTATLESALSGTPMAIVYKMSPLTYSIAKRIVKMPYIGLANIVLGEKVVPEFIQEKANAGDIADCINSYLENDEEYNNFSKKLQIVHTKLGDKGAAERTADFFIETISQR